MGVHREAPGGSAGRGRKEKTWAGAFLGVSTGRKGEAGLGRRGCPWLVGNWGDQGRGLRSDKTGGWRCGLGIDWSAQERRMCSRGVIYCLQEAAQEAEVHPGSVRPQEVKSIKNTE